MAAAGKLISSLHIAECDFNWLILSKMFYLVIFSLSYHLTAKYKTENIIAKLTFFKF